MKKRSTTKIITVAVLVLILTSVSIAACAKPAPAPAPVTAPTPKLPDKLQWNVSVWGGPRVLTYGIEDWASDMRGLTDGRWEIKVHYGGVLSPSKEGMDGLKAGMFEAVLFTSMYRPGNFPLQTVCQLPFLAPATPYEVGEWWLRVAQHPAIQAELDAFNAKILFPTPMSAHYAVMSKVPIKKCEDFDGVRARIDTVGGKPLMDFGCVPTMMPAGDIYTALERGMLDAVVWSWSYTFGSYKLYELCDYAATDLRLKTTDMFVFANKDAWNALPDEWKELCNFSTAQAVNRYGKYLAEGDAKWVPIFKEAGLEITSFPPKERARLVAKAESVWEDWVKDQESKGLPGREILDFAIAKRDEVVAEFRE